jgi:peptidyl-prolyl cis-trans isomerase A (cyclophilin A)
MKALLPLAFAPLAVSLTLAACTKTDEPEKTSPGSPASAASASAGVAAAASPAPRAGQVHPDLLDPANAKEKAPDVFKARFNSTKGDFVIEVHRDWAPNGADRFYNLVKLGFFDDTRFFRAVDGFMVQFGISGDPFVNHAWQNADITDDPSGKQSNKRGFVTFAQTNMPNSRATQVFINFGDNSRLDGMRFVPFGQVTEGMEIVDSLYKGYGEGAPMGSGPEQGRLQAQGNVYADSAFPKLDAIKHAEIAK